MCEREIEIESGTSLSEEACRERERVSPVMEAGIILTQGQYDGECRRTSREGQSFAQITRHS